MLELKNTIEPNKKTREKLTDRMDEAEERI